MKDFIKVVAPGIGLVLVGVVAFSIFAPSEEVISTPMPGPAPRAQVDTNVFKQSFIDTCESAVEGSYRMEEYCLCAYNYFDSRLTKGEFFDLSINYEKGVQSPMVQEAIDYCVAEILN